MFGVRCVNLFYEKSREDTIRYRIPEIYSNLPPTLVFRNIIDSRQLKQRDHSPQSSVNVRIVNTNPEKSQKQ